MAVIPPMVTDRSWALASVSLPVRAKRGLWQSPESLLDRGFMGSI